MKFHSGNIVVVRGLIKDKQGKYPFLQRRSDAANNPNKWEVPGGKRRWWEPDYKALTREIREEINLSVDIHPSLKPSAIYERPLRENPERSHITRFYLGRAVTTRLVVQTHEVQDADWFWPEEILASGFELTDATRAACTVLASLVVDKTTILVLPNRLSSNDQPFPTDLSA